MRVTTGTAFAKAAAEHFGLPPNQVNQPVLVNCGPDEILSFTFNVVFNADDLIAIAQRMRIATDKE